MLGLLVLVKLLPLFFCCVHWYITSTYPGVLTENTDDFIIGDRVWVGGTKPGYIQFIGDTKFAPGEWAGIVLDEPIGKNDGSLGGIRYFMCEPKRGVFSRLTKLTRDGASTESGHRSSPKSSILSDGEDVQTRRVSSPTNGVVTTTRRALSPTDGVTRTTRQSKRVTSSPNTGGQVLTSSTTTTVKHDALPASSGNVRIGDRILVGGTKAGVLRYMGTTDFATGQWCGVELDEPLGKNDGTVAGKKYFDCKTKYGLFAPIHKVSKQPGSSTVTRVVRTTRVAGNSPTSSLHKRSGSRESLGSMSTTSQHSTSGTRVRLGVTSLTSAGQKSGRPQAANVSATNTALQETLREKEQHIDQLLKEREMERSEVAQAAAQVEATESQLASLQVDYESLGNEKSTHIEELKAFLDKETRAKQELLSQLEDEKRKVEDLEFRLEEEALCKGDDEFASNENKIKFLELEQELEKERQKSAQLETQSKPLKADNSTNLGKEDELRRFRNEVEILRKQLEEAHGKIVNLEMGAKKKEVAIKDDTILQLQVSFDHKKKEVSELQLRIAEMERELDTTKKRNQRQQEIIDNMQRKLAASQERCDQLNHQKVKLEEQLSQLISTSGDNSEQLSHMNESIKSRDKQIEKLQSDLQKVKQQSDEFELKTEQLELHNQNEIATLEERSNQEKQILLDKLKSLDEQLQDASKRLTLADSSNLDDELNKKSAELEKTKEALGKKEKELVQLNVKLQESELKADCNSDQFKKIQVELQQSKQVLENYKQDSEKQLEKSTSRLTQINADKEQAIFEKDESLVNLKKVEELLTDLKKENAIILKEKDAQTTLVNDKDIKVLALKEEVNRLNSEFNSHKEDLRKKLEEQQLESGAVSGLSEQLKQYHKQMQELQDDFLSCEKQNQDLRADVERLCEYESQKIQLEEECIMLKKQLEIMKERENKALFEYKSENNSLQQMLDSSQMQMGQQKRNLEGMQSQLNTIQSEKMCVMTNEVKTLKEDKHKLLNELKDLHSLLSQYKNNSNETTPEITTLQELKESSEAQIEFLNSVIVDMQKKNDDLTSKVEILETGVTLDSSDINLNGIRTAVVAPRLFCDICDVFDLHDTDDCPKQAMSDSPPPTKHHGERNQQRPYCEVCEVFGHDTKECDDAETF
ncbi:CAP-Gly domain-containing linker protein 1 [Nymphon striatum]|nr:CAP-Gly domain-containing linker protein 1 [Nymphon striatum]